MDSIEDGATIRMGMTWENKIPEYSLKINKKTETIGRCGDPEDHAKDFAETMNDKGIKNYVIYNGERIDWVTNKWESCYDLPPEKEERFKKTLEENLKD